MENKGPFLVGKKADLMKAKHSFRTVGGDPGRDILVLVHEGVFYAIDYHCYHAAGPLENGDIEELGGKLCIICPKHKYKIALANGEGLVVDIMNKKKGAPPVYKSKGIQQRVHTITESDGDIYVTLSQVEDFIQSDFFQGPNGKEERDKVEAFEEMEKAAKAERKREQEELKAKFRREAQGASK